jgi:hypothetical protein
VGHSALDRTGDLLDRVTAPIQSVELGSVVATSPGSMIIDHWRALANDGGNASWLVVNKRAVISIVIVRGDAPEVSQGAVGLSAWGPFSLRYSKPRIARSSVHRGSAYPD